MLVFKTEKDFSKYDDEPNRLEFKPSKIIDLRHVTSVYFHYDRDAPVKSKKLLNKNLEHSRFDIYTPTRQFNLKTEEREIDRAVEWVAALQESVEFFA